MFVWWWWSSEGYLSSDRSVIVVVGSLCGDVDDKWQLKKYEKQENNRCFIDGNDENIFFLWKSALTFGFESLPSPSLFAGLSTASAGVDFGKLAAAQPSSFSDSGAASSIDWLLTTQPSSSSPE